MVLKLPVAELLPDRGDGQLLALSLKLLDCLDDSLCSDAGPCHVPP